MQKKLSIRNKITVSVMAIIMAFGIITAVAIYFVSNANFIGIRKDGIIQQTIEQSHETGQIFASTQRLLNAIVQQQVLVEYVEKEPQQQDARILEILHHYNIGNTYDPLYVLDKDGVAVVSTDATLIDHNYGFREYFKRAINGEPFVEAAIGATTGRPGYYFSYPIRLTDGIVGGVLVGKMPGGAIDASLRDSILQQSGHVMLIDEDGIVFYSSIPDRLYKSIGPLSEDKKKQISTEKRFGDLLISELHYSQVMDAIRVYTEPVALDFYSSVDKKKEIASVAHIPDAPFFLIVEANTDRLSASALNISLILGIVAIFAALIAAAFVYLASSRYLRPIGLLKSAAEKIKGGDYTYRLDFATGDEFEDVGNAFGEMAEQLQTSYADLNERVAGKTLELSKQLEEVEKKNSTLQDTQRAVLNVLEDSRVLELQLQEERDRFKNIIASMGEGLFVLNKDLRIILVNPTAERILGIAADKLQDVFLPDVITFYKGKTIVPVEERPLHRVINEKVILTADIKDDFYWEVKGGRRFALGLVAAPISVGGLVGGVIIFRDLTREKNLDDARTSFISITSHQLRTPLTSLKWFLEMLMDGSYAQPLVPEQKKFTDLAYQAADRMMGIINLLLQIARVEAGRVKVTPTLTDLQQFTRDLVGSFGNAFSLKKQTVDIVAIPDPLPPILIDNDIMGQVLQNLISNANRYALEDTTITITFKVEGNKVVCSVTDRGIGITKADATRIFEKFYRAENALRMVPEGSGLGLSLVKSLVEGWGGMIWFESKEWKGTTFFFTIPLAGMAAREGEVGIRVS